MNIYLNNDVISDLSLTDSELGVYVALRNIYLSNRDYQVVTFNMIAYELFGNKEYKPGEKNYKKKIFSIFNIFENQASCQ